MEQSFESNTGCFESYRSLLTNNDTMNLIFYRLTYVPSQAVYLSHLTTIVTGALQYIQSSGVFRKLALCTSIPVLVPCVHHSDLHDQKT